MPSAGVYADLPGVNSLVTRRQGNSNAFSIIRIVVGLFVVVYPINNWIALFRGTIDASVLTVTYLTATVIIGTSLVALGF